MRYLPTLTTAALVTATSIPSPVAVPAPPVSRAMTISGITYIDSYGATDAVRIWRDQPADIVVRGRLLDLATGIEVRTASGGAQTELAASITARQGGDDTRITVHMSPSRFTSLASFQVLIHYLVETNGPDKFTVRVFDRGIVNQIRIAEPAQADGSYLTGKDYTLIVSGDRLDNAKLFTAKTGISQLSTVTPPSPGTPSATEQRFGVRFGTAGVFTIDSNDFFDRNLPAAPPTTCPVQCYEGSATFAFKVVSVPIFASVSTQTPNAGTQVTVNGTNLVIPGMAMTIRGKRRYEVPTFDYSNGVLTSGGSLLFTADPFIRQDSLRIEYRPTTSPSAAPAFTIDLPPIAVQGGTPSARFIDTLAPPGGGTGSARKFLVSGRRSIIGRFLAPNTLRSFTLTQPTTSFTGVSTTSLTTTLASPSQPTMSFGQNPLVVVSAKTDPTLQFFSSSGADLVTFDMFAFTDTIAKTLTLTTPGGSVSIANVLFIPPPRIDFVRRRLTTGLTSVVNDGKLFRGETYEIGGVGLIIPSGNLVAHSAVVRLNGQQLTVQPPTTTPGSTLVFTVPNAASSGPLTVQTVAGTSGVTMTVENVPTAISIAGFQLSPTPIVGGQSVTGTVAINTTVPSGTSIGSLVFTTNAATANAVGLPLSRGVTTNPVTVAIPTRVVRTPVTATITVADANTPSSNRSASVAIVPPSPTAVTLSNATVVGGTTATATIQMSGPAVSSDSIIIALTNSDPTTATVPSSVILNGGSAVVQIPTQVVPATRTVTITATSGGQSRTAQLTVNPPSVASITPNPASVIGLATVPVAFTMNAPLPAPQTATIACIGEGLTCPGSVTVSGNGGTFNVTASAVPTPRTATITMTVNGIARSGSLDLQPLGIQTMTISPATVRAGTASSITIQLNRTGTVTLQLSSSDSTVVIPPSQVQFGGSTVTQLVTINTRGPLTANKSVTITATGTLQTPVGTGTITKSATLTVTP